MTDPISERLDQLETDLNHHITHLKALLAGHPSVVRDRPHPAAHWTAGDWVQPDGTVWYKIRSLAYCAAHGLPGDCVMVTLAHYNATLHVTHADSYSHMTADEWQREMAVLDEADAMDRLLHAEWAASFKDIA
jgi:hypothetical protein